MNSIFFRRAGFVTQLRGGLGNQLFSYTSGIFFSEHLNLRVFFETSESSHSCSLKDLGFEGVFFEDPKFVKKAVQFASANSYLSRYLGILDYSEVPSYFSPNIPISKGTFLKGFFQNLNYLDRERIGLVSKVFDSLPVSLFVVELEKEILETDSVLIHIRRGDYFEHKDTLGLLSPQYFLDAIKLVGLGEGKRLFVLSDSPELVADYLGGLSYTLISSDLEFGDYELMRLFRAAKTLVLSNSSFSLWGALLNEEAKVIYPESWYRSGLFETDSFPATWIPLTSFWED